MATTRHPMYYSWAGMKQRCLNENNPSYKDYGGRGITICERWMVFDEFRKDMEDSYKAGWSIERKDNNGNYCFENCVWADRKIQNNNTRRNRFVEYEGLRKTLYEWSRHFGIKPSTLRQRFYVYKWDINKCFNH